MNLLRLLPVLRNYDGCIGYNYEKVLISWIQQKLCDTLVYSAFYIENIYPYPISCTFVPCKLAPCWLFLSLTVPCTLNPCFLHICTLHACSLLDIYILDCSLHTEPLFPAFVPCMLAPRWLFPCLTGPYALNPCFLLLYPCLLPVGYSHVWLFLCTEPLFPAHWYPACLLHTLFFMSTCFLCNKFEKNIFELEEWTNRNTCEEFKQWPNRKRPGPYRCLSNKCYLSLMFSQKPRGKWQWRNHHRSI
jgi:hypothetical protein